MKQAVHHCVTVEAKLAVLIALLRPQPRRGLAGGEFTLIARL